MSIKDLKSLPQIPMKVTLPSDAAIKAAASRQENFVKYADKKVVNSCEKFMREFESFILRDAKIKELIDGMKSAPKALTPQDFKGKMARREEIEEIIKDYLSREFKNRLGESNSVGAKFLKLFFEKYPESRTGILKNITNCLVNELRIDCPKQAQILHKWLINKDEKLYQSLCKEAKLKRGKSLLKSVDAKIGAGKSSRHRRRTSRAAKPKKTEAPRASAEARAAAEAGRGVEVNAAAGKLREKAKGVKAPKVPKGLKGIN